jgi:hypothetical protein
VLNAKTQCLPDAYFKPPAEQRKHALHNKIYNIQDLNSTSAYVRDVEIYGDLRTGYIEISLWHDVEVYL